MGFSVSGSAAIIFIGVIVAAGIALPPVVGSFGSLAGAQGEQVDRGIDALNTEIEIELARYDDENDELTLDIVNTGSTTLSRTGASVLVDGDIKPGVAGEGLWVPGETITVTVEDVTTEPDRVKVVVENGIAETVQGGEIEG